MAKRQKVIYSNPRGTLWANDKQKFGQKLLESMGWKEGSGLGKDQNGITENVKASFKFDNKGLGYKPKPNDWIEDNNVYEQILADLSKQYQVEPINKKTQSEKKDSEHSDLELKTKSCNRLHYKKFIKAKNLSIKSKEDLYCVFPTKNKTTKSNKMEIDDDDCDKMANEPENEPKNSKQDESKEFKQIESKLSVQDYFQQKMKKLKRERNIEEKNQIKKFKNYS